MAQPLQLPIVTTTRLEISPGQEIGIHDFLRGLKRPRPKVVAAPNAHDLLSLNAMAAVDHSVCVPFKPPPSGHFEEQNEVLMSPTPAGLYAKVQRPTNEIMEAPTIVRTCTRKAKTLFPGTEKPRDPSPLFFSQGLLQGDEQLTGGLRHNSEARMDNPDTYVVHPSKRGTPLSKANSKDDLSELPIEQRGDETSTFNSDITRQDKKWRTKANEKKRRLPVNELALVPSLPTHSISSLAAEHNCPSIIISSAGGEEQHEEAVDDIDLALLGELDVPLDQASSNVGRPQRSREANIGKPGTRFRKAKDIPQRHSISHTGFRFPPATPKGVKTLVRKLGSGFEGTKLESTAGLKVTKAYRPRAHCVKHNRFQTPSMRSLELSTTNSPSVQGKTCRRLSNGGLLPAAKTVFEPSCHARKKNVAINRNISRIDTPNAESGDEAVFDKVRALATPMRALIRETDLRESVELSAAQTPHTRLNEIAISDGREPENSQNIQEPSKSERVGWLNRHGEVSFVIRDGRQGERHPPQEAFTGSVEHILNTYNGTWYGEARTKTQQTLPSRLFSKRAIQVEQIAESFRSDERKTLNSIESESRLGEEDEMLLDELVTDHDCQTLRPSRSIAIDIPIAYNPTSGGSNDLAFWSRFQIAKPSRITEVQDSQERRRKSSSMAVMEPKPYIPDTK